MRVALYGDSLTAGSPGVPFLRELESMLAGDELKNYGRRGETVVSLYHRLRQEGRRTPADVAVLWVGVNDVLAKVSHSHAALKLLLRQPPAQGHTQFQDYYERTIDLLRSRSRKVVTLSPLLIGEDMKNQWNGELHALAKIVATVSSSFDDVAYVDLHKVVSSHLEGKPISEYIPKCISVIAFEVLFLRTPNWIDRIASRRGLHLTLDGVHLNSVGALVIARELRQALVNLP